MAHLNASALYPPHRESRLPRKCHLYALVGGGAVDRQREEATHDKGRAGLVQLDELDRGAHINHVLRGEMRPRPHVAKLVQVIRLALRARGEGKDRQRGEPARI